MLRPRFALFSLLIASSGLPEWGTELPRSPTKPKLHTWLASMELLFIGGTTFWRVR